MSLQEEHLYDPLAARVDEDSSLLNLIQGGEKQSFLIFCSIFGLLSDPVPGLVLGILRRLAHWFLK